MDFGEMKICVEISFINLMLLVPSLCPHFLFSIFNVVLGMEYQALHLLSTGTILAVSPAPSFSHLVVRSPESACFCFAAGGE